MVKNMEIDRLLYYNGKRYNPVVFIDGISQYQRSGTDTAAIGGSYPRFLQLDVAKKSTYPINARHGKLTANAYLHDGSVKVIDKKIGHYGVDPSQQLLYWRPGRDGSGKWMYSFP